MLCLKDHSLDANNKKKNMTGFCSCVSTLQLQDNLKSCERIVVFGQSIQNVTVSINAENIELLAALYVDSLSVSITVALCHVNDVL